MRSTSTLPFRSSSFVSFLLVAATCGCAASVEHVDAERSITEAIPAAGAITFRMEASPVDEGRAPAATLPLADAIQRALECDPSLQAALARVHARRMEAEEAALPPDPVLDVVLRFGDGGELFPEIGIAQELVGLLSRSDRVSAAENRLRAEAAGALTIALDVLAEVQSRYAAIQSLEALALVLRTRVEIVDKLREVAAARLELGEGTRADLAAFEIEKKSIEIEAGLHGSELRLERLALARLIGEPSSSADWSVDPWLPSTAGAAPEQAWIDAALRKRPEIQQARWELAAADDEVELASSSAYEGTAAGVAFEHEEKSTVGPSLSLPIPWSGRSGIRQERALALQAESRHRLTEAERRGVEEVRAALDSFAAARANLDKLANELLPLLESRRSDVDRMYQARELDVTTLLLADQALLEARTRRVELERQVSTATHGLQRAVGGPAAFEQISGSAGEGGDGDE